jgi:hypothetical protein
VSGWNSRGSGIPGRGIRVPGCEFPANSRFFFLAVAGLLFESFHFGLGGLGFLRLRVCSGDARFISDWCCEPTELDFCWE